MLKKINHMKKIAILNMFFVALLFAACNEPMMDIYNSLDSSNAIIDTAIKYTVGKDLAPDAYTLTDEDYKLSSNEAVAKYKNFSESALPKDFLPEILNQKFFAEDAFAMAVTYNYYEPVVADSANAYELSDAEYEAMGQSHHNFSDESTAEQYLAEFLGRTIYGAENGDEKTVHYLLYKTNQTRYVKVNADGTAEVLEYASDYYELDSADYDALGNGKYQNFYKIENALNDLPGFATSKGHTLPKVYKVKVYKNYYEKYPVFIFDGVNWAVKQSVNAVTETLNYAVNKDDPSKNTWWADPAIKITLTTEDYDSNDATSHYDNFDLRDGKTPGTDRAQLVEMIGAMLDANHNAVDDQQYLVSFAYYDGTNGTSSIRIMRTAGVWAEVDQDGNKI